MGQASLKGFCYFSYSFARYFFYIQNQSPQTSDFEPYIMHSLKYNTHLGNVGLMCHYHVRNEVIPSIYPFIHSTLLIYVKKTSIHSLLHWLGICKLVPIIHFGKGPTIYSSVSKPGNTFFSKNWIKVPGSFHDVWTNHVKTHCYAT